MVPIIGDFDGNLIPGDYEIGFSVESLDTFVVCLNIVQGKYVGWIITVAGIIGKLIINGFWENILVVIWNM